MLTNTDTDSCSIERGNFVVPFNPAKVVYVFDGNLAKCTDKIVHIKGRSWMVHELIKSYGLLKFMERRESKLATREDLLKFHSQDYLEFLFRTGKSLITAGDDDETDEDKEEEEEGDIGKGVKRGCNFGMNLNLSYEEDNLEEFGLGYDCPVFKDLESFALRVAGGTITAAEALVEGADVAINWCGGWHHAQRSEASGFCYVNDIVLGIHNLQKKFKRILYVDLDGHHGDGVENAFAFSDKVMTLSFHHFDAGYFPGTGASKDVGQGRGKFYSLNVPLKGGVTDQQFIFIFESVIHSVIRNFQPEAIVIQCGADCLAKDPLGAFNLTLKSITHCVRTLLTLRSTDDGKSRISTLLLGGGGYNVPNAARLWTSLTAEAIGRNIGNDIPDNQYFLKYGPDYVLEIEPGLRKNENDDEYVSDIIQRTLGHLLSMKERKKPI